MRTVNLPIQLDADSGSLQQQIYASVRGAILNRILEPGRRIPSSRTIAHDLSVSRTTAILAIDQLRAEGYLVSRHGSGTFVADELPDLPPLTEIPRAATPAHPAVSRRGLEAISILPPALHLGGAPRPFRPGTPALDLFPVSDWARIAQRRIRAIKHALLDYSHPAGVRELQEAIAEQVRSRGTSCGVDQILITGGVQRGLDLIAHLLLDPNDWVWMEDPGYSGALCAFRNASANVLPVPVDAEGMDVKVGRRHKKRARLVYVSPSHQFPLGVSMSLARRKELLEWAQEAGAWIVEDDYDSEFRYQRAAIHCLHGLDTDGRVIYLGTFSKSVFPALRLGFMILPRAIHRSFLAARVASDFHPSTIDQLVLAEFIQEGHYQRHLRRMRSAYRERLEALNAAASRYARGALTLRPVQSGLHAIADLSDTSAEVVFREACRRNVEVVAMSQYYIGRGERLNGLLLGFGSVKPESMNAGMQRLVQAVEAARRESPSARVDLHAIYDRPRAPPKRRA